jgi:hypothetical protein
MHSRERIGGMAIFDFACENAVTWRTTFQYLIERNIDTVTLLADVPEITDRHTAYTMLTEKPLKSRFWFLWKSLHSGRNYSCVQLRH